MADSDTPASIALKRPLVELVPLILEEWPQLSREALDNLADDPEATVIYVATHTDHTRTLVRRHLEELASLRPPVAAAPKTAEDGSSESSDHGATVEPLQKPSPSPSSSPTAPPSPDSDLKADPAAASTIDQLLGELEARTDQLIQDFKADMLPELEKKARSNLGTSLLMALGLGLILGLLLGGKRG